LRIWSNRVEGSSVRHIGLALLERVAEKLGKYGKGLVISWATDVVQLVLYRKHTMSWRARTTAWAFGRHPYSWSSKDWCLVLLCTFLERLDETLEIRLPGCHKLVGREHTEMLGDAPW
jgi:hypothetical protein